MQLSVATILIVRNGEPFLGQVLAGIGQQRQNFGRFVVIDARSSDTSRDKLLAAQPDIALSVPPNSSFAEAVEVGVQSLLAGPTPPDWIWVLHDDSVPEIGALRSMLDFIDLNPSAKVLGPKVVSWNEPGRFLEFGQTIDQRGQKVRLSEGELDQSQFDDETDVLAVGTPGILIAETL